VAWWQVFATMLLIRVTTLRQHRHCERSEAIQRFHRSLDRFVARAPRDDELGNFT